MFITAIKAVPSHCKSTEHMCRPCIENEARSMYVSRCFSAFHTPKYLCAKILNRDDIYETSRILVAR